MAQTLDQMPVGHGNRPIFEVYAEAWLAGTSVEEPPRWAVHSEIVLPGQPAKPNEFFMMKVTTKEPPPLGLAAWRVRWTDVDGHQWYADEPRQLQPLPFTGQPPRIYMGALCARLAAGERRVVRYDLRDCGASTTVDPQAPAYTLHDLAADAAALVDALGAVTAHLGGIGVGGMVAQVAARDHPGSFSALTLVGTRTVALDPVDDDLPDHDPAVMSALFSRPMPDWSDRAAVIAYTADSAALLGDDPEQARATAARIWDRTPSNTPPAHEANQLGMVFSRLDCTPRWRERLGDVAAPTLVVHGRANRFFPVGNGNALAAQIPGARLLVIDDMATAVPDSAADEIAAAMLDLPNS